MRIFYAAPGTPHQTQMPKSNLWRANLHDALVSLGHEVVEFDYDFTEFLRHIDPSVPAQREFIERQRPRLGEELRRQILAEHRRRPFDLFFSYFYAAYVAPEVIREIGSWGLTTINWYCNASYQFHLIANLAPAYHVCLVPEKFRLDDYRRIGANPIYCQEAANPDRYRPLDGPQEFDVTFAGQKYGNRPLYLRRLLDAGVDVRVWGPHWDDGPLRPSGWVRFKHTLKLLVRGQKAFFDPDIPAGRRAGPLDDAEYVRLYSRSRISLGFTAVAEHPILGAPIRQVRLRDFEAPMCGAFYLVEHCDELAEFFEPDREIVCFRSPDELVDKARYYLAHPQERERIRLAGHRRARAEHTWQKRFEDVFRKIGKA